MGPTMKNMDWRFTVPLLVSAFVAILGWFSVNWLAASRDQANKRREIRVQYLIEAYRRLALSAQRPPESKYFRDMESAVADIQLFGSQSQVQKLRLFLEEFKRQNKGSFNELLRDLRNDLRKELDLTAIEGEVQWFRPETGEIDRPPAR